MRARGPDAEGIFTQGRIGFGHRRLSILDLAPASQQPMVDSELGLGLVFNGCIYNFRELRSELRDIGYRFFSQGDTEVVLKAYHAWGSDCVRKFKGMFALALWERDTGRVLLVRDRLGIKPLYYAEGRAFSALLRHCQRCLPPVELIPRWIRSRCITSSASTALFHRHARS
jgi:asparagine synthase (glutamine-hydrolysing)